MYADDSVLAAETREHLQHIMNKFERAYDGMVLKINIGNSKVLMVKKNQIGCGEKGKVSVQE